MSEATALLSSQAKAQQQPLRPSLVRLVMEAAVANSDAKAAQKLLRMPGKDTETDYHHTDIGRFALPACCLDVFKSRPDPGAPLFLCLC